MDSDMVAKVFKREEDDEILQCLIDTDILIEILERRRRRLVKVLEAKVDASHSPKVQ